MKLFYAFFFCLSIGFTNLAMEKLSDIVETVDIKLNTLRRMQNNEDLQIIQETELKDRSMQILSISLSISDILKKKFEKCQADRRKIAVKEQIIMDMNYKVKNSLIKLCQNLDIFNNVPVRKELLISAKDKINAEYVATIMEQVTDALRNRWTIDLASEDEIELTRWLGTLHLITAELKEELTQAKKP